MASGGQNTILNDTLVDQMMQRFFEKVYEGGPNGTIKKGRKAPPTQTQYVDKRRELSQRQREDGWEARHGPAPKYVVPGRVELQSSGKMRGANSHAAPSGKKGKQ